MGGRLRLLTTCFSIVEARICVSKLDAYGVYALAPLQFVTVHPHLMIMHGGVPVWVLEQDLETAQALYAAIEDDDATDAPRRRVLEGISGALLVWFYGVPPGPSPAFGRSQLWFSGPAVIVTVLLLILISDPVMLILMAFLAGTG